MLSPEDKKALEASQAVLDKMAKAYIDSNLTDYLDLYPGLFDTIHDIFDQICEAGNHIQEAVEKDEMPTVWKDEGF